MKSKKVAVSIIIFIVACILSTDYVESRRRILSQDHSNTAFSSHPYHHLYQSLLEQYVREGLPGLAMLIKTPEEGLWMGAAGMSRIEDRTPMSTQSLFHSASVVKTFIAAAILLLKEEGQVNLDASIDTYLPDDICDEIPNGRTATVRHLLGHTSGIPDISHIAKIEYYNNPFCDAGWQMQLETIYGKSANFAPGTDYEYVDMNFVLLALIIEHVTGKTTRTS